MSTAVSRSHRYPGAQGTSDVARRSWLLFGGDNDFADFWRAMTAASTWSTRDGGGAVC